MIVATPQAARFHAKGPANTGHAALACTDCHKAAPGTVRQQLQAKVQFWLGRRATDAAFGHEPRRQRAMHRAVTPAIRIPTRCIAFSSRNSPRRAPSTAQTSCVSCHREHTGVRVTMAATSCASCHGDLELKREPLDVSHRELVARKDWTSCLGCHDYHGNHKRAAQTRLDAAYPLSAVADYFAGGPSPYGTDLKYPTKTGGQ